MRRLRLNPLHLAAATMVVTVGGGLLPAGTALATPTVPAPTFETQPVCKNFNTGDDTRQLSVCASIWLRDEPGQSRGKVIMHTYKLSNLQRVGDSVSQSITLNEAQLTRNNGPAIGYGTVYGPNKCRLNTPSGPISSCSVPNTARVVFYGEAFNGIAQSEDNCIIRVSWRDDLGPHYVEPGTPSHPNSVPFCAPD
jgi:hypothetical protein